MNKLTIKNEKVPHILRGHLSSFAQLKTREKDTLILLEDRVALVFCKNTIKQNMWDFVLIDKC